MIKAIIFDLGGVIVFNDLDRQVEKFAKELKIDVKEVKRIEKESHEKMILGKLSIKEFCSNIRNSFNLDKDSATLLLIWERVYSETTELNKELLHKIAVWKKKYKTALVSNCFDSTAQIHQRQKLNYYFKSNIFSCRIGLAKPEVQIFAKTIHNLGVKGNECLFIDDNEKYVAAAKEFGMKTIQFKDNKQLFKEMKKLKIV